MLLGQFTSTAYARKPAVEDFVGVETEKFAKNAPGTEVLFEFGNSVKAVRPQKVATWERLCAWPSPWSFSSSSLRDVDRHHEVHWKVERSARPRKTTNVTSIADYAKESDVQGRDSVRGRRFQAGGLKGLPAPFSKIEIYSLNVIIRDGDFLGPVFVKIINAHIIIAS